MINTDIQETKNHQQSEKLFRDFKNDLEFATKELDKIEKKEKRLQLILAFYAGVAFTLITIAIAILVNKGIHP